MSPEKPGNGLVVALSTLGESTHATTHVEYADNSVDANFSLKEGLTIDDIPYIDFVNGVVSPLLVAVTLITNLFVCAVLVRPNMRSATNVLLVAMAVSDTLTGLCPLPAYLRFFSYGADRARHDWLPFEWCYAYYCLTDYMPTLFHTASIWLTVALAVQRYVCVCRSVDARRWCTVTNSLWAVAIIYAASCLYQACRFFDTDYTSTVLPSKIKPSSTATMAVNATVPSETEMVVGCLSDYWPFLAPHIDAYFNIYYWFRIVAVHLVPCCVLVALNAALVAAMRRAQARRRLLLAQNRKSESRRVAESNVTTMMLVAVVGVFLVVEFPLAAIFVIVIIENTFDIPIVEPNNMATATLFVNMFILLSYPVNFFIYAGMSRQFRSTLRAVLLCRSPSAAEAGHGQSTAATMAGTEAARYVTLTTFDNGRIACVQTATANVCTDI